MVNRPIEARAVLQTALLLSNQVIVLVFKHSACGRHYISQCFLTLKKKKRISLFLQFSNTLFDHKSPVHLLLGTQERTTNNKRQMINNKRQTNIATYRLD